MDTGRCEAIVAEEGKDLPLASRDPSLRFGLNAPPTVSQSFVPGGVAHIATATG